MKRSLFLFLAAALCGGSALGADQANSPEARLRDALRNTMLQLRSVTAERDNPVCTIGDTPWGFNEAAVGSPRKAMRLVTPGDGNTSFNEAAVGSPRKGGRTRKKLRSNRQLQ